MGCIIGITASNDILSGESFPGSRRQIMNMEYGEALLLAGAVPLVLVQTKDPVVIEAQMALIDGLLLTGGVDVAPLFYGEEPHAQLGWVDADRDAYEFSLLRQAEELQKPVFGICRGIQVINVAFGGSLYQDLSQVENCQLQHRQKASRDSVSHSVDIIKGTYLAKLFGEKSMVNSFHHQAIKKIAPGFKVSAFSPDGIVEGIEREGAHFVLGVQWHPEHLVQKHANMLGLFRSFIKKSSRKCES